MAIGGTDNASRAPAVQVQAGKFGRFGCVIYALTMPEDEVY